MNYEYIVEQLFQLNQLYLELYHTDVNKKNISNIRKKIEHLVAEIDYQSVNYFIDFSGIEKVKCSYEHEKNKWLIQTQLETRIDNTKEHYCILRTESHLKKLEFYLDYLINWNLLYYLEQESNKEVNNNYCNYLKFIKYDTIFYNDSLEKQIIKDHWLLTLRGFDKDEFEEEYNISEKIDYRDDFTHIMCDNIESSLKPLERLKQVKTEIEIQQVYYWCTLLKGTLNLFSLKEIEMIMDSYLTLIKTDLAKELVTGVVDDIITQKQLTK